MFNIFDSLPSLKVVSKVMKIGGLGLIRLLVVLVATQTISSLNEISVYTESQNLKSPEAVLTLSFKKKWTEYKL